MLKTLFLSIVIAASASLLAIILNLDMTYVILGMFCYHVAEHWTNS